MQMNGDFRYETDGMNFITEIYSNFVGLRGKSAAVYE